MLRYQDPQVLPIECAMASQLPAELRYIKNFLCILIGLFITSLTLSCSDAPELIEEPTGRIVLAEYFTFARCTYCPWAEHALDSLSREYGDSVAVIAYHRRVIGDTLSPAYVSDREALYGITTSPSTVFDGVSGIVQTEDPNQNYTKFKGWVLQRRNDPPRLRLSLEVNVITSSVNLKLHIVSVDSIATGNHNLFIVVYEDSVYFTQAGAPDSIFSYVVRQMIPDVNGIPVDLFHPDSLVEEVDFNPQGNWNKERLGVVIFVQNMETKEVLQAIVQKRLFN